MKQYKDYTKAAKHGDAKALHRCGVCKEAGLGTEIDLIAAVKRYTAAANAGSAAGHRDLGWYYDRDIDYDRDTSYDQHVCYNRDDERAFRHYERAAELGDLDACYLAGTFCEEGRGFTADLPRAVRLYRQAADQGHPAALWRLGRCCEFGLGVPKDLPEAIRLYRQSAETGFGPAHAELGRCYREGIGVPKDLKQAAEHLAQSGAPEETKGRTLLGLSRWHRGADGKLGADALIWLSRAANTWLPEALFQLGEEFLDSKHPWQDPSKALEFLGWAGDTGYVPAMVYLTYCYEHGIGTLADPAEALRWEMQAIIAIRGPEEWREDCRHLGMTDGKSVVAEQVAKFRQGALAGTAPDQCRYAFCLERTIGAHKDPAQAARWYRAAADQGLAAAQY